MIVGTRESLLDRIGAFQSQSARAIHFRLAVLARRLHEQAIDRAQALLHRSLARRTQRVDDSAERVRAAIRAHLGARERTRRAIEERLRYFDLRPRLRRDRERLQIASTRAVEIMRRRLTERRRRLETLSTKLTQLDPRLILSRGYAIVLNDQDRIVREASDARVGSDVKVLLAKDSLKARIIPR